VVGTFAGLAYGAPVRRADYDLRPHLAPAEPLEIFLPGVARVGSATSAARGRVTATARDGGTVLVLDRLDAGDILLLRGVE
jgi:hypothetical protein